MDEELGTMPALYVFSPISDWPTTAQVDEDKFGQMKDSNNHSKVGYAIVCFYESDNVNPRYPGLSRAVSRQNVTSVTSD